MALQLSGKLSFESTFYDALIITQIVNNKDIITIYLVLFMSLLLIYIFSVTPFHINVYL